MKKRISLPIETIYMLPTDREYTEVEAVLKISYDIETKTEWSVNKYADEFGWSRTKVEALLEKTKLKQKQLEVQRKVRNVGTYGTLEDRKKAFYWDCAKYVDKYSKEMVRKFFEHWTGVDIKSGKMLWELQDTFAISGRLATWKRNDIKWNGNGQEDKKLSLKFKMVDEFNQLRSLFKDMDDASVLVEMGRNGKYTQDQLDEVVDEFGVDRLTGNFNGYKQRKTKLGE